MQINNIIINNYYHYYYVSCRHINLANCTAISIDTLRFITMID